MMIETKKTSQLKLNIANQITYKDNTKKRFTDLREMLAFFYFKSPNMADGDSTSSSRDT